MEEGWQGEDSWRGPVGGNTGQRPWPSRGQARPRRRAPPLPALLPVSLSPKGLGALSSPPHFHSPPPRSLRLWPWFSRPPSPPSASAMDAKVVAVLALVLAALCLSDGECVRRRRLDRSPAPGSRLCAGPRCLCLLRPSLSEPNSRGCA